MYVTLQPVSCCAGCCLLGIRQAGATPLNFAPQVGRVDAGRGVGVAPICRQPSVNPEILAAGGAGCVGARCRWR